MTKQEMRDFYEGQIEYYNRSIAFCDRQIAWYTERLKRNRKEDREHLEWIWAQGPLNKWEMEFYSVKDYKSEETKKSTNSRARYYREKKRELQRLEQYKRKLQELDEQTW